ncbi:phospholipase D-like domain-containing protein [Haloarchaeobius sp. DFWS5]|uniref:phospholipase D-like domain-containing protein n=1 Tax=Haloarchaeobius sp. DFWS5 TaxID=3446114 RepID=UPI003EB88FEC
MRAFSLDSDALSYFLGFTLLHYDRPAIVSAWLSDVEVKLPVNNRFDERQYRLSELIPMLDTKPTVVVNSTESHNDYIVSRLKNHAEVIGVDDLHAKAIISDEALYAGSANITQRGFGVNRELCKIVENEHGSTTEYLKKELGIARQ